jgi:ABC-type polysaccharide/polyol phosphate export permease
VTKSADLAFAMRDLVSGFANLRAWTSLAWDDLAARYRRTVLGPFWITISHAFFIGGFAFWSSTLLKQDLATSFVYIAAGLTVWSLISTSLSEAGNLFVRASGIMTAYDLPVSIHAYRFTLNQLLAFGHNLIVYIVAVVVTKVGVNANTLFAVPGLFLVLVCIFGWALALGCIGARFRDVAPLLASLVGALLIFTPIFWRKTDIASAAWMADVNPFFHLLETVREPMLGNAPATIHWIVSLGFAGFSLAFGVITFVLMRRKLNHWT